MRVVYPYNEILPKKKAHDVFIVQECAAFAELGWDITLLVSKWSEINTLFDHYHISSSDHLHIKPLFIIRKKTSFRISWNLPFFLCCQQQIQKIRPDWVFLSVRKQAA